MMLNKEFLLFMLVLQLGQKNNVTATSAAFSENAEVSTDVSSIEQTRYAAITDRGKEVSRVKVALTEMPGGLIVPESSTWWQYSVGQNIMAYGGVFVVVLGVIGNCLSITVLLQKRPLSSTSMYLVNLAVADLVLVMVSLLFRHLARSFQGFDILSVHPWICKMYFVLVRTSQTVSYWTLVSVTVERTLVVYLPLKAKSICTRKTATTILCVVDLTFALLFCHYTWTWGPRYKQIRVGNSTEDKLVAICSIATKNPAWLVFMKEVRPWLEFVLLTAAPFIILCLCNILIVTKLLVESRRRRNMSESTSPSSGNNMRSLTVMLLTVSCVFLVCITPKGVLYFLHESDAFSRQITDPGQAWQYIAWATAILLINVNHAINFILYCASGRHFRESLLQLIRKFYTCSDKVVVERNSSSATESSGINNNKSSEITPG